MWEYKQVDSWSHTLWMVNAIGGMFSGKPPELPPILRIISLRHEKPSRNNLIKISPEDQKALLKGFVKGKKHSNA